MLIHLCGGSMSLFGVSLACWTSPSEANVMGLFPLSPAAQIKRNTVMKVTAGERFRFKTFTLDHWSLDLSDR